MSRRSDREAGRGETDAAPVTPTDVAILVSILIVASVLRVIDLSSPLWYDEILTLTGSVRRPLGDLVSGAFSFNNHPFYSLQAKAAIALFGESAWSIRLPALLFGAASVAAVWRLALLLSDAVRAHVTALLVALSYHHIWYSQNARAYTELMFWFVTATLVLIRAVRAPTRRAWALYGLVMAATMYTHLTAATFFIAQGVVVAAIWLAPQLRRADPQQVVSAPLPLSMPATGFLIGGALTIALYAPFLEQAVAGLTEMPSASAVDVMAEYQNPLWSVLEIMRSFARPSLPVVGVGIVVLGLTGFGMIETARRDRIAAASLLIHIPLTVLFLMSLSARIWPRFFFADMGFLLFFLTQGVFVVCTVSSKWMREHSPVDVSPKLLFGAAAAAMLLISGAHATRNYAFPKQDLAGALAYVESNRGAADPVVTLGFISVPYTDYFETGWPVVASTAELVSIQSADARTWLVMGFPARTSKRYPGVMQHLARHYSLAMRFPGTLGDGDILVYAENRTR